jgi:polyferredoxin
MRLSAAAPINFNRLFFILLFLLFVVSVLLLVACYFASYPPISRRLKNMKGNAVVTFAPTLDGFADVLLKAASLGG